MNNQIREASDIVAILKEYLSMWPTTSKAFSENNYRSIKMYSVQLVAQGIPPAVVRSAMSILCCEEQYYPSLARIISVSENVIKNVIGNQVDDADVAWAHLVSALKKGDKIDWTPHIRHAIDYLGGLHAISSCETSSVGIMRAQFREGYNNSVRRAKEENEYKQVLAALPEATQNQLKNACKMIE